MDKNSLIREKKKLESKQEKLKTIIENNQNELNFINDTLKKTCMLITQIEKAETEAASLFGKVDSE